MVVSFSSGTSHALAPITERHKIPLIAIASDEKIVHGRKYAFNFWVTPEAEAEALVPEAIRRGYKRIARVTTTHDGAFAVRTAFDRVNQGRIELPIDEEYTQDVKDFRTLLTKIKLQKDLDAIHPTLFPGQLSSFAKQARSLGITLPIFGWEFFEDINEIRNADGALLGAWYVNADDAASDFVRKYTMRFPDGSLYSAPNGHDVVLLLAKAAAESPTSEGVRELLSNLKNFSGALGTYSASGDQRFTLRAAVKEVTADGFRKIS